MKPNDVTATYDIAMAKMQVLESEPSMIEERKGPDRLDFGQLLERLAGFEAKAQEPADGSELSRPEGSAEPSAFQTVSSVTHSESPRAARFQAFRDNLSIAGKRGAWLSRCGAGCWLICLIAQGFEWAYTRGVFEACSQSCIPTIDAVCFRRWRAGFACALKSALRAIRIWVVAGLFAKGRKLLRALRWARTPLRCLCFWRVCLWFMRGALPGASRALLLWERKALLV